jgi:hypothetical protein
MITMQSLSHWGMFPCWEVPAGLPPMVEQPKNWMHVDFGTPYQLNYALCPHAPQKDDHG